MHEDSLEAAHAIAVSIAADAIRADGQCNWIGATVREGTYGEVHVDYEALSPSIYDGTSGIAIFLAEVAAETGDRRLAVTAVEATRQALQASRPDPFQLSPYLGTLGVVLVSGYTSRLLKNDEIGQEGERRRADLLSAAAPTGFDLLSGSAGAVLGLLALYDDCGDDHALELALSCADTLVRDARLSARGASWAHPTIKSVSDLTGLSHGSSGPIVALLEAHRRDRSDRYLATAMRALEYETRLFNPEVSNWPDFRSNPASRGSESQAKLSYAPYWCHGAPGTVASRLRILDVLDREQLDQTVAAVSTTARAITAMLGGSDNYSMCHGLSGNTEVLLLAAKEDLVDRGEAWRIADEVCAVGVERHLAKNDWPSGVQRAPNPSLFLGTAGVGRLLLRRSRPELPSLLIPTATVQGTGHHSVSTPTPTAEHGSV
jgi:class II lanthipeptide synthase